MTDVFGPDFAHEPFWWREARPAPGNTIELPERCDVLVIGAGYAGLGCALELARAGTDVVVVDASHIGAGASSRAAGLTSGRAGVSKQIDLTAAVGPARAQAILAEADEAFEHLEHLVETGPIDCDYERRGRFVGAHTPAAYAKLAIKMAEYNEDGRRRFEMVTRQAQGEFVNSRYFHGGMLLRDAGSINPAKYHAGLRRLCAAAGATLVGNTRVLSVEPSGQLQQVVTSSGAVLADHVMLATGGYTDGVSRWHQRRIIPMSSTIIATERLGRDTVSDLLPGGCPVIDSRRVIRFARPSPDREHILFGGRARFTPVGARHNVLLMHAMMREVFPRLERTKVINAWAGFMAFTFDFLPKVGFDNGMHYAMACNGGSGIVMMPWLGRQAARNILGSANRPSAFEGLPFKSQPLYTGAPWFVPIVGSWYRFRDYLDLRAAGL